MAATNLKDTSQSNFDSPKLAGGESGYSFNKLLQTEISLFAPSFGEKQKEAFYLELSTLLDAGLDIKAALELLAAEQTKSNHSAIIESVKNDLIVGYSLWEAMSRSGCFTAYEYFAIQIGEETGKLILVLNQLSQYFSYRMKQKRQLINALSYPAIILITSIGAVGFMLLFIVPMFTDVFKRFGGELPGVTKLIISVAALLKVNIFFIGFAFICFGAFFYIKRDKTWMRDFSYKLVRKIPVVGDIIRSVQLARFCGSMSLLLGSKVPMLRTLNLMKQMVLFSPIQKTFDKMADDILHGSFLYQSMAQCPIYDKRLISLVKIGEEVNKLDVFFDKLAKQYSSDAEYKTGLLNTFLEPVMIIFLGCIVGFILLAMYLPMFEMSTSIGR